MNKMVTAILVQMQKKRRLEVELKQLQDELEKITDKHSDYAELSLRCQEVEAYIANIDTDLRDVVEFIRVSSLTGQKGGKK